MFSRAATSAFRFSSAAFQRDFSSKVCVIGSGNWGSVAARIVGQNALKAADVEDEVKVWVFEEEIEYEGKQQKLTEVINRTNQNVKYLPGADLGKNVVADPDLLSATEGADLLVFVTPHQFIKGLCGQLKGNLAPNARAISLIKGMDVTEEGFELISGLVNKELGIDCSVLMGANIASEIALEKFSEATVGYADPASGAVWQQLFHTPYFHVRSVQDTVGPELCGTLKNIVALGAGFVDGLDLGNNTKAAIIRIGFVETMTLAQELFPGQVKDQTFFESAGIADLITTCFGGRNRKCAEAFVRAGGKKSFTELETELLNGQKLQGVLTSHEVQEVLEKHNLVEKFPLFTTINRICSGAIPPSDIVNYAERP